MKVFEPMKINGLELKNRIVVSAMVTNYCTPDGNATEKFIAYHEHKAKGGWGLIITEDYAVTPTAGGFVNLPGLWEDGQIESHRKLTERVHAAGGKIAAQIYHAGRETSSAVTGVQPVAPSAVREPSMPETPRELTIPEIHTLVEQFGDCAKRAKAAGFDAVEVHGAHGYLVGAFASPFSNKRSDEYGGTIRNRARFGMEIIRNIKEKCGEDYPVLYRISSVEYVPGGLDIEESKVIARLMEEAGADCIHCSQGVYASTHTIIPPSVFPRAGYVEHAAEMKKAVQIPVIAVGRINDVEIAESVLQSKKADLVTMARASLADPELPNKVLKGRGDEVIRCIGCLQGCIGENGKGNGIRCLINPLTGMEDEYDLTPAEKAKQVLVIGGGIAGCEAAISAALKGHKVTLIEKNDRLGGQWIPASVPIGKSEFTSFLCWQKSMLEKMHVQILLNTTADAELIKLYEPDTVIIATGSRPFIPPIQGADQDFVVTAHDVLLGKTEPGNRVVVIGGGLVGAETADMLGQQCEQVTIIEMLSQIMKDGEAAPTKYMKERFSQNGVQIHTSTKLLEIGDHTVTAEKDGERFVLENIDTVIIAVGVKTDRTLLDSMEHVSCKVLKVGDANGVKNGYLGIREGYEAGLNA
ncbi:NAD(P)/FAD-dependent oxidoreductase [Mediterraneibacter gnavus]|uniref:NAD(P)/FAD-dependent oxidoreductase n=3 Tax=Mediterraneibacter gnavus TaxID=33038 RepID=UPI00233156C8|nr:NAD(P)/FAD-dependent oxidoreductase [Mediterraneibacter gnavus]MDB8709962.1 NAD(P)/FAD-dependent oxidoreductase [Mediterraneibacter gnavus]MDB8712870.1 NAD(P)/FAD-dependent oxidoreductase [Mediterraneibacter gnavus]